MIKVVVGASRNSEGKIGSEAIQWWMGTDYSHVYVRWHLTTQDKEVVYHAASGMVHFVSLDNFTKHNTIVREFDLYLTDDQFKKFSARCIDLAGEKYSYIELLQIFLSDVSGGKIRLKDQPGYICSELLCELFDSLGIQLNKPKFLVRPDDIVKALEKHENSRF